MRIDAIHVFGATLTLMGCNGANFEESDLVLNEFMASNQSTIADEGGGFADWVELHNKGTETLSLRGYALTDDLGVLDRGPLGDLEIAPGGFLLFWADSDLLAGPLHLPFGLLRMGEELGLSRLVEGDDPVLLDAVSFGAQTTDVSVGRSPDGTGEWVTQDVASPGASNP